jgi:hypothetical protein
MAELFDVVARLFRGVTEPAHGVRGAGPVAWSTAPLTASKTFAMTDSG